MVSKSDWCYQIISPYRDGDGHRHIYDNHPEPKGELSTMHEHLIFPFVDPWVVLENGYKEREDKQFFDWLY